MTFKGCCRAKSAQAPPKEASAFRAEDSGADMAVSVQTWLLCGENVRPLLQFRGRVVAPTVTETAAFRCQISAQQMPADLENRFFLAFRRLVLCRLAHQMLSKALFDI